MVARWSDCRDAARRGQLSHADLVQLLEAQAAVNHWARINRWLPLLLERGVGLGERKGSLIAIASIKERQRHARNNAPVRCNDDFSRASITSASTPDTPRKQGVCIGFSMQKPVDAIEETPAARSVRYIVFGDGLALPIAGSGNASAPTQQVQIKRWPSGVQDNLTNFGLEGSSELSAIDVLPPWYSADVVRLPQSTGSGPRALTDQRLVLPHQLPH